MGQRGTPHVGRILVLAAGVAFVILLLGVIEWPPPAVAPVPRNPGVRVTETYDGRFTFTRVRYEGLSRRWSGRGRAAWAHDYPDADHNLQTILREFTAVDARAGETNVLELEDPEIFRNPILYISEPGFWYMSEEGTRNLRQYLLKGGFLILDDFEGRQWDNMAAQLARALPDHRWFELEPTHPVFQSFFLLDDIYVPHPLVRVAPAYHALFEENGPGRRVMVLANHNADLAEYWEWSPTGYLPVDPTNDAYRLGVNYVIYGLTH